MLAIGAIENMIAKNEILGMVAGAIFGATISGGLTASLFGQPGQGGFGWACLGAVVATLLGAAIGGVGFALSLHVVDGQGTVSLSDVLGVAMLSSLVVASVIAGSWVAPVWMALMLVVHVAARWLRETA